VNKHRIFHLRDRDELLSLLPALPKKNTESLLGFLDAELDREGPLDKETFALLLDQAVEEPLRQETREKIFEFLRTGEERHSKTRIVSLIRDVILINITRFNPYTDNSIGKSIARDMLP